jgi:hypothetical protein
MTRPLSILVLVALCALAFPSRAEADATAFLGFSPTPASRAARGFALGMSLLVVGFEFEYSATSEDALEHAPGLKTGMINGLVQTPTHTQLYLTAGGGVYRERSGQLTETSVGTNIGGGIKIGLIGPVRLRLDYRVFSLHGQALYKNPQRFYAGFNLSF